MIELKKISSYGIAYVGRWTDEDGEVQYTELMHHVAVDNTDGLGFCRAAWNWSHAKNGKRMKVSLNGQERTVDIYATKHIVFDKDIDVPVTLAVPNDLPSDAVLYGFAETASP